MLRTAKKIFRSFVVLVFVFLVFEFFFYWTVFRTKPILNDGFETVLVYGGALERSVDGLSMAEKFRVPIFISESVTGMEDVKNNIKSASVTVTVDSYSRTTDQNARNAVEYLKKGNYRTAILVTNWWHMPRALFLTKLYLLGSNINVEPCPCDEMPSNWLIRVEFWDEFLRFWGSLGRVVLAVLGFNRPWFHI